MKILRDTIDFTAYERETNFAASVRKAPQFLDRLLRAFSRGRESHPEMFSTKLRDRLHFRRGECTVWAGYNGHRKSIVLGQVALDLAVQGERILLMSFEMSCEQTLARMARQAIGVEHPTEEQLRRFSAWTDDRIWLFDHVGRITPANALAVVNYAADELEIGHIVIDSMMMVCTSEEHLDEQKAFATDVVRTAIDTQTHIHVVAHCRKPPTQGGEDRPPTKYELRGSAAISDQMHNVVTVWSNKAKDRQEGAITTDCDAVLSVEKQRNGRYEGRIKAWFDKASMRLVDDGTSPIEPYAFMRTV